MFSQWDLDRFMSKVRYNPETGCWEWTGFIRENGYGSISARPAHFRKMGLPRSALSHRFSYLLFVGEIPEEFPQLDHLCRVRHCVNPDHLEPVTQKINSARGLTVTAANAAKTHCVHGHEFDPENTYVDPRGARHCRKCQARRDANRKKKRD